MSNIQVIDRNSGQLISEKIYGKKFLSFLYGKNFFSKIFLPVFSKLIFFSLFYGFLQKTKFSRHKILPFILNYHINTDELEKKVEEFSSFNDFFIRKLRPEARPINIKEEVAILPADGRYMVFENIDLVDGFYVKEKKFDLASFLQDEILAMRYQFGSMAIARLSPVDYHRFHFPFDCFAQEPKLINGYLYSVNPIAIKKNINIFSENKRVITILKTRAFGEVLYIEVGATNVGTIHQTFLPENFYKKGEEKGYFSLGGSSIVLLFQEKRIKFDRDLVRNSEKKVETRAFFGQSLGLLFRS
jgi:phosphatidylserine decarboxylase